MSLADFLFQGTAPSQSDVKATQTPLWLSEAIFNTVGAAGNLAQQPYQPYGGPRVATPSADTLGAEQMARSEMGSYQPYLDQAQGYTNQAGAPIDAASIQDFLNPYQKYITQGINQNLQENILPGIQDKFVSAGQTRSPQEAELTGRAVRDTQQEVGSSMAGAYQNAVNSLLQQRGQLGQLGSEMGQLGALRSQLGAGNVALLGSSGATQDALSQRNLDTAYQEYQNQQQWPYQQLGFLSNIIHGIPSGAVGSMQSGTTTGTYGSPSGVGSLLGTAAQLGALGGGSGGNGYYAHGGKVMPRRRGALSVPAANDAMYDQAA